MLSIRSDERILKSHVNRELILAIRERDRLFTLINCTTDNVILVKKYDEKKKFVEALNEDLKATFESERIEAAAGDDRKTWQLYKEILFNQTRKTESAILINRTPIDNTVSSCNLINDHFCTVGENLATSIIAIHGYDTTDIVDLYEEHSSNNWSFQHVNSEVVADVIKNLPNKSSTGLDKVPIVLLKSSIIAIALVIATCFNAMVDSTDFPSELLKGR